MRTLSTVVVAGVAAAGLAAPALASSFTPTNAFFTAVGPVTITTPQGTMQCTVTFVAVTTGGGEVEFLNASLNGSDDNCFENSFAGNPWYVTAIGTRQGKILAVSGFGAVFSPCGPGALPFSADNKTSVWTLKNATLPGNCTVSGSLTISPATMIVP
jgi:hypothetical protein